jgi:hypothetical protein
MTLLRSIAFLVAGAVVGAACSHAVTGTARAGTPQYKVVSPDVAFSGATESQGPAALEKFLNAQAAKGYELQQVNAANNFVILVKQ